MHRSPALLWVVAACACGGAPAEPKPQGTVFDPTASPANLAPVDVGAPTAARLEVSYPALDLAAHGGQPWVGVSILHGSVRLSRPSRWMIRDASVEPGHAYLQYVSPKAYSFAIYERSDSPGDSWRDVEQRYEPTVVAAGAKIIGQRIPMATGTNQGRAYTIERKQPLFSRSREILVRGSHHVVLVQIVSQDQDLARFSSELLEVLSHLEVL